MSLDNARATAPSPQLDGRWETTSNTLQTQQQQQYVTDSASRLKLKS